MCKICINIPVSFLLFGSYFMCGNVGTCQRINFLFILLKERKNNEEKIVIKVNEKNVLINRKKRTAQKSEGTILPKIEVQPRVHCFQCHLKFRVNLTNSGNIWKNISQAAL